MADQIVQKRKPEDEDDAKVKAHNLFSWMGLCPPCGSPCYKTLLKYFPDALPGIAVFHRTKMLLTDKEYGLTPKNTLYGTSLCPDEINSLRGNLDDFMKQYWGLHAECFPLGGIGGAPFAGKTGFAAFSGHVPDNGNILIVFGPHMGISTQSGEIGKYHREGQSKESTACGAITAGYSQCCAKLAGTTYDDDPFDMQQAWIRQSLDPQVQRIKQSDNEMAELFNVAYEMVEDSVQKIVHNNFGDGCLVLLGGIEINLPPPFEDHFVPKLFEVRRRGHETKDLLHTLVLAER